MTHTPKVNVTIKHVRAVKPPLCASGMRDWFKMHDLSWSDFLTNGIDADLVEQTGDDFAFKVTSIARKEAQDGR